jgi:hypothetical protein
MPHRYELIKKDYEENFGSFVGKRLVDFCSGPCEFSIRFLRDGGSWAEAYEKDDHVRRVANTYALMTDLPLLCHKPTDGLLLSFFDIAFLLDSYGYAGTLDYVDTIKDMRVLAYISAPREKDISGVLAEDFKVTHIGSKIYRCEPKNKP